MPPHHAAAAGLAQRIQFVDEDDARRFRLRLLEHVADPSRPDADKHLDKVAARKAEERHARLPGHALGQQGLARAGRAHQQHPLGDPPPQPLVLLRALQKLHHLPQFLHRLVDTRCIVEGHAQILLRVQLAPAAPERHRRTGTAQAAHHQHEDQDQQAHHHKQGAIGVQKARTVVGVVLGKVVGLEQLVQRLGHFRALPHPKLHLLGMFMIAQFLPRDRIDDRLMNHPRNLTIADDHLFHVTVAANFRVLGRTAHHLHIPLGTMGAVRALLNQPLKVAVGDADRRAGVVEGEHDPGPQGHGQQVQQNLVADRRRFFLAGSARVFRLMVGRHLGLRHVVVAVGRGNRSSGRGAGLGSLHPSAHYTRRKNFGSDPTASHRSNSPLSPFGDRHKMPLRAVFRAIFPTKARRNS